MLLTDGEKALKKQFGEAYTDYTHVLDLIHVPGYLWKGADAQFGAGTELARQWVRSATLRLLQGGGQSVVEELSV